MFSQECSLVGFVDLVPMMRLSCSITPRLHALNTDFSIKFLVGHNPDITVALTSDPDDPNPIRSY